MITNACATQAIVSVLLNADHSDIELGTVLSEFKDFSRALDPAVSSLMLTVSNGVVPFWFLDSWFGSQQL